MTPERMRELRRERGLTVRQMGLYLGLHIGARASDEKRAAARVREFESGAREISGPVLRLYQILEADLIPDGLFTDS